DARRGPRAHAARAARAHDRRHPVVSGVSPPGDGRPGVPTGGPGRHLSRARRRASPGRRGTCRADAAARRGGRAPRRGPAGHGTARTADRPTARPPVSLAARGAPGSVGPMSAVVAITAIAAGGEGVGRLAIVGEALRRIAKLDVGDPEIVEAVEEWRYRAKISLAVKGGRGRGRAVGLHPYDRPAAVFPLKDCHIADLKLMALWRELKQRLELLPARLTQLILRLDREGRRHVIAESSGEPWLNSEALRAALPDGANVICWWQPVDGAARVVAGPATGFPATAFEHVNPEMGTIARRWATEQRGDVRGAVVWELDGGIGDTAVAVGDRGAQVVSVDADEKAIDWARRREVPRPVRFIAGRAEDVLPTLPEPSAVVVSPPRAGLHWNVTLRLTGQPVNRLIYVSGDPATLARDLHRLSATYRVTAVRAFDLFPQTAHVETV